MIAELFADQRADGGRSPFWAREYSSLDATCFRLAKAEQLGIPQTEPSVALALGFLAQRQSSDGSWEEDQQFAGSAPAWARPGELAARLYLTADCGFWLAVLGGPSPRTAMAAGLLQDHLGADGRLPGFLHTHWLAAGLWHKINRPMPFVFPIRTKEPLGVRQEGRLIAACMAAPNMVRPSTAAMYYVYTPAERSLRPMLARVVNRCIDYGVRNVIADLVNKHRQYEPVYQKLGFSQVANWARCVKTLT